MPTYQFLMHPAAFGRLQAYRTELAAHGIALAGQRLQRVLAGQSVATLGDSAFLACLLATKQPLIFAESAVYGDGRDWTPTELSLLGDIGVAAAVEVFDDGRHRSPGIHPQPFPATLLFIPGALLRNGTGHPAADWDAVTRAGRIDSEAYQALYERRLTPLFSYANDQARAAGQQALITVPGLGCGQFAGPFQGQMGGHLNAALQGILARHASRWPAIRAIHFDPFDEGANERHEFAGVSYRVRPLLQSNQDTPQLCAPGDYAEAGEDFSKCRLFSLVAWDHVSWPGNDFYGGSRCTDDGVKAAATTAMRAMTGIAGRYDPATNRYNPPAPYPDWESVVQDNRLRLRVADNLSVLE